MTRCAFSVLLAAFAALPLAGQTVNPQESSQGTAALAPPQLYGSIDGDLYTSPTGTFQVRIPVLPQLGGTVFDTPNVVTFADAYSTHITIGAFPLSHELTWEYQTRGAKNFLIYFFTNLVMPDFARRFHGAHMEDNALYLSKFENGSMLIFTLLPGGSYFARRISLFATPKPLVAKRGNLCFVKNGYVYIVSAELASHVLDPPSDRPTDAVEDQILRKRLTDLVQKMIFIKKPPEAGD